MKIKNFFAVVCLLLLFQPCAEAEDQRPFVYTIVKGDTLWDISERFIDDPFYWPKIWADNPYIENPHLIFPGQKLRIHKNHIEILPAEDAVAVSAELSPAEEAGGSVPEENFAPATDLDLSSSEELVMVSTFGGARSFIADEEIDNLGTLIDSTDNKILISENDVVFLEMRNLAEIAPGDLFDFVNLGKEVAHPISRKSIGYQSVKVGTVEITGVTPSVAVGIVTDSSREIVRGTKVRRYQAVPDKIALKDADEALQGYVVSADEGKLALGQWDVIHVDIGSEAGLEVGHQFDILRDRQASKFALDRKGLKLPDIDLGDAVVIEVRPRYAAALVTSISNLPIYRGDKIETKTK
ncbi:MAG: hypothetical protein C0614_14275 [Desulfuromonas sp.]|nr:MAG: hypothetical protein C0614_14275 [Desulfuromonas sp.]